jgi:hypothetical protein
MLLISANKKIIPLRTPYIHTVVGLLEEPAAIRISMASDEARLVFFPFIFFLGTSEAILEREFYNLIQNKLIARGSVCFEGRGRP